MGIQDALSVSSRSGDRPFDAACDDFSELGFAFLTEELAIIRGDGVEVILVLLADGFESGEGVFKMSSGP